MSRQTSAGRIYSICWLRTTWMWHHFRHSCIISPHSYKSLGNEIFGSSVLLKNFNKKAAFSNGGSRQLFIPNCVLLSHICKKKKYGTLLMYILYIWFSLCMHEHIYIYFKLVLSYVSYQLVSLPKCTYIHGDRWITSFDYLFYDASIFYLY